MTKIDFYVLPDDTETSRVNLVCQLAEKAIRQSEKVHIHTDDPALADSIDLALWRFREDSFVPHRNMGSVETPPEPVDISCGQAPVEDRTLLINLGSDVPTFFSRFARTLEVINQHEEIRSNGRERYSFYQKRGYPLKHHKL